MSAHPIAVALAAAAVLVTGCGGTGDEGTVPPPAPDAGPTVGADPGPIGELRTCESPEGGYTVSYPADWNTNAGDGLPPCSAFDPSPVELPEAGDVPLELAILLGREGVAFEDATGEGAFEERLAADELAVAGRPALRVESRSTGMGLIDAGVVSLRYYVDLEGETLIAETHDVEGTDHGRNRRVLERMLETLELDDR